MTKRDELYWRQRAGQMIKAQLSLRFILRELIELMPETNALRGFESMELKSAADKIVGRHLQGELDADQAVGQFFELVFADAAI